MTLFNLFSSVYHQIRCPVIVKRCNVEYKINPLTCVQFCERVNMLQLIF